MECVVVWVESERVERCSSERGMKAEGEIGWREGDRRRRDNRRREDVVVVGLIGAGVVCIVVGDRE